MRERERESKLLTARVCDGFAAPSAAHKVYSIIRCREICETCGTATEYIIHVMLAQQQTNCSAIRYPPFIVYAYFAIRLYCTQCEMRYVRN